MFGLGWQELLIILGIALVIFGPSKLPELGKSMGKAISSFREGTNSAKDVVKKEFGDIGKIIEDKDSKTENDVN